MTYFDPALDPPLGVSGRITTTLVRDHEYFIPTKFHQNPLSDSGEEVENVKSLRRTDDGRTVRYDNSSLEPSDKVSYKALKQQTTLELGNDLFSSKVNRSLQKEFKAKDN